MKKKLLISVLSLLAIGLTTGCNDKNSESSKPTLPPVSENTSKPEESTEESTVKPTEEVKYTLTVHAEGIELSTLESSYKEGEEVSFSITICSECQCGSQQWAVSEVVKRGRL